jgi:hypothetical protein
MIKVENIFLLVVMLFLGAACQDKKEVIAERIQYDVNIKSPDPEYDWWIQNLPGPQRERFVDLLIDRVVMGKLSAYDYFYSPLTTEEVASILSDTTYYTIIDEDPPYTERDTISVYTINKEDVQRVRFLEEWKVDPVSLDTEKKVLGLAPIAKRYDASGVERWQPLFWIILDEDFKNEINNSN